MTIETRVLTDSFIKMAAYVSSHDRSVLSKCYEDGKVSVIQNSAHKDILSKCTFSAVVCLDFFCLACVSERTTLAFKMLTTCIYKGSLHGA